jgi:hypothetical protein
MWIILIFSQLLMIIYEKKTLLNQLRINSEESSKLLATGFSFDFMSTEIIQCFLYIQLYFMYHKNIKHSLEIIVFIIIMPCCVDT